MIPVVILFFVMELFCYQNTLILSPRWLIYTLCLGCLFGCSSPQKVIQDQLIEFPLQVVHQTSAVSHVSIPLSLSLAAIENKINQQISWTFQNPEWPDFTRGKCSDPAMKYQVTRDSIHLRADGTTLYFEMDLLYSISGQLCPTCWEGSCMTPMIPFSCGTAGEGKRRIHWIGKIMWGIDSMHQIKTISETVQLSSVDPCEVTFLKINITDVVVGEMRKALQSTLQNADRSLAQWDSKSRLQQWCNDLYSGVKIADVGYLSARLEKVYIGQLRSDEDSLFVQLGVETILDWRPNPMSNVSAPLPKIIFEPSAKQGFQVGFNSQWSWTQINEIFNKNMLNKEWPLDDQGGYIIFRSALLTAGANGKLVGEWWVDFKKQGVQRKKVKVSASMDVDWNEAEQILQVKNIEWDLDTRHLLLKWGIQAETWNQDWQKYKWTQISFSPYYPQIIQQVNQMLMSHIPPSWSVMGGFSDLKITHCQLTEFGFNLGLLAMGRMQVKVSDLQWVH